MRKCEICGAEMTAGYCFDEGQSYYCSDECLRHDFSEKEWREAYESGESYWTEWEAIHDHQV